MLDEGIPLRRKWLSTGKIDFSNPVEIPASGGSTRFSVLMYLHIYTFLQTFMGSSRKRIKTQG